MAHLFFLMKEPGQADRVLIWDTRTLSIGRAPDNDLTVDDEEISRKHAMLLNERGCFEIGDYRTGNGTFVNGKRVGQKQPIKPGDVIAIGKLQLEFCQGEEHPAKLGHKLEYASQLKTVGMVPQGADAGSTMLGLADTAPPTDDFVIEPERSSGERAFTVGAEGHEEFQVREFDDGFDQIELELDESLDLMDSVDAPPAGAPQPPATDPGLDLMDPVDAPPASEPQPPAPDPGLDLIDPVDAPPPSEPQPPAPDPNLELMDRVDAARARKPQPRAPAPRARKPQPPAPDPNSQSAPGVDPMERLRKLKMLHDEGLITDEEFQTKRAQILKEM
jgi:pSer/pThr/pTyr-binding forkhead associated (FHA) protein